MKYKEIIERVECGEEFFFYYNNEQYWISQNELGKYLTRARDSKTQEFNSAQELFDNGVVEGKTLLEIWEEIKTFF